MDFQGKISFKVLSEKADHEGYISCENDYFLRNNKLNKRHRSKNGKLSNYDKIKNT